VAPKTTARQRRADGAFIDVHRFTAEVAALPDDIDDDVTDSDTGQDEAIPSDAPRVLDVLVEQIAKHGSGRTVHQLWHPALDETPFITLDEMASEFWGRRWDQFSDDAGLVVPFAREDDPFRHAQDLVSMPVGAANVGIVGGLQRGKSTALLTLMAALAVSHSPQRVQFYGVDFGGGKLASMAGLPHVCGIAGRGQEEKIRRIVSEVERIFRARVRSWGVEGLDLVKFRSRKFGMPAAAVPEDGHGDVFLVIDNIKAFQGEMLDVHDRVVAMAEGAINYGIHVIVTNDAWLSIKQALEAKLSRIELRVTDKNQSMMGDREVADQVPTDQAGRGLVRSGKVVNHMLVVVPRLRQFCGLPSEQEANEATAAAIEQRWTQLGYGRAPELEVLPAEIAYDDLPAAPAGVLKLGIGEQEMSTIGVNLLAAPHFYAAGSSKSGRTTVLRTLCAAIMETYTPEQAEVILIDPSYDLADAVTDDYRKVYVNTAEQAGALATELANLALRRKPPAGLTPQQQKEWKPVRPKWFMIVDDLNLLTVPGTTTSVLTPMVSAIEQGQRIDLHLFAATTSEQWYAKGRMNKVIQAMDTGGAGALVMDGLKSEIIIDQVRAAIREPGRGELYYRKLGGQLMQVALPPAQQV
jgi:S-DNA-T family DNA segregation ATPase FtsK/SpoIIIE